MASTFHESLPDIRAKIAQRTIRQSIARSIDILRKKGNGNYSSGPGLPGLPVGFLPDEPSGGEFVATDPRNLPKAPSFVGTSPHGDPRHHLPEKFHVGIIGAGMAGLYTAMILKSLGLKYEILEASERIGGRVYTHRFTNKPGDYYDVGAMRFPDMALMARTFDLFKRLGIPKDRTTNPPQEVLIPYYFTGPNTPSYFNNILVTGDVPAGDAFDVGIKNGGKVPDR